MDMDSDLEKLRQRVIAFCNERGYSLSPDADKILLDTKRMKETTGEFYCPCRKQRNLDTVCICKPVHNGLVDIMNLYLNQGKYMSIPVFAFFDQNLNPLCQWIERPKAATQFMEQLAGELSRENLGEEQLRQERRNRSQQMANEWRQETVKELKELLHNVKT